jgi:hypothetical protein
MTDTLIVEFKSTPEMYAKEQDGRKSNTLRFTDPADLRFIALAKGKATHIEIINKASGEHFKRKITDYTEWGEWSIISWRHEP